MGAMASLVFLYVQCWQLLALETIEEPTRTRSSWAPVSTSWARGACSTGFNSTPALLRCMAARHELGQAAGDFSQETQTPTEEADKAAQDHIHEISQNSGIDRKYLSGGRVLSDQFLQQLFEWQSVGNDMARIYALKGGSWDKACKYTEANLGYRYSLEHWMRGLVLSMEGMNLVDDINLADYVYLPHCATGIFMHATAKDFLKDTSKKPGRNSTIHREADMTLVYEGNLQPGPVRYTEDTYLMRILKNVWNRIPEYESCYKRKSCRFLIVSIYGRHVFPKFADALGSKAVWVTHAGLSGWISQSGSLVYNMHDDGDGVIDPNDEGAVTCRAACKAHCRVDPPGVLPADVVLPWVVAFRWTKRSENVHARDVLAFYSGTGNSCSRARIAKVLQAEFDVQMSDLVQPAGSHRSGPSVRSRVLAFPPEFRLAQQDWSELAFRSRVCICPDGDSPNTGRLVEVVMHGCVPLIISNRLQPPLHEYLNWHEFSFFLREDAIPRLPTILHWLMEPEGRAALAQKQKHLPQAAFLMDYNHVGIGSVLLIALRDRKKELAKALQ